MTTGTIEHRAAALEIRAARDGRRLEGYAARFNVEAQISDFVETIKPGAFAASLKAGADILALVDHSPSAVLARTRSGSLMLSEDTQGLHFDLALPTTQAASDVLALAERGDLGGMSFGFLVPDGGDSWQGNRRELRTVDLREISVISAWPAYPQTSVSARSRRPRSVPLSLIQRYIQAMRP